MTTDLLFRAFTIAVSDLAISAIVVGAYFAGRGLAGQSVVKSRVQAALLIVGLAAFLSWGAGTHYADGVCISGGMDELGSYCDEYDPSLADSPEQQWEKGIAAFIVLTVAAGLGAGIAYSQTKTTLVRTDDLMAQLKTSIAAAQLSRSAAHNAPPMDDWCSCGRFECQGGEVCPGPGESAD